MSKRVVVIGGGVVGLASAVRLLEAGHRVAVITERPGGESASGVAPALFTPYPGVEHTRLMPWVEESLETFRALERTEPDSGVHSGIVRWYKYSRESMADGPWEKMLDERILPTPPGLDGLIESTRPHMDMTRFVPWLERRVPVLGGTITRRRLESVESAFDEHVAGEPPDLVVNASGLGARTISRDESMVPMRGLVARVPNTIGATRSLHDDAPGGKVSYVFVYRDHLAIGSTFEPNEWRESIDDREVEAMFDRARNLLRLDGVERWRELSSQAARVRVGLRPARMGEKTYELIRLERAETPRGPIIHNYGHGRSGVTLCWGCAREVVSLASS